MRNIVNHIRAASKKSDAQIFMTNFHLHIHTRVYIYIYTTESIHRIEKSSAAKQQRYLETRAVPSCRTVLS